MSDHASGHSLFDELAAGYALDALEPTDEQLFLQHARGCPQCTRTLAGFREVAAAMADTAPPAEPSAQLGDRILAMARADVDRAHRATQAVEAPGTPDAQERGTAPQEQAKAPEEQAEAPQPAVRRLRPRRSRWLRPVSIAAAAAVIAAGGIWGGLEATSPSPKPPAAFCAHGCSEVVLTAVKGTHEVAGKVFVQHQSVWMQPTGIKPDNTADQIYVLWQIISTSKAPLAIGSFDVHAGEHAPIEVGSLVAPYHGTTHFAVSLEPGRAIPPSPSVVTAIGSVT